MSLLVFDLETTGKDALGGDIILLCGYATVGAEDGWIDQNQTPIPYSDDKELAIQIRDTLELAEGIISWNGHKFDLPFLNTRLAHYGERPLLHLQSLDLMVKMKELFPYVGSNIGAKLEEFMVGLGLPFEKTQFNPALWFAAINGDEEAMKFIADHCENDVKGTRAIFEFYFETDDEQDSGTEEG